MFDWLLRVDWEAAATTLPLVGLLVGGTFAFLRFDKEQRWKRKEFTYGLIRTFEDDPAIKRAQLMLDWSERQMRFPNPHNPSETCDFLVTDALIVSALRPIPAEGLLRFTPEEMCIRDGFDHFLTSVERFDTFIEAGLIRPQDVEPYLHYWFALLADGRPKARDKWAAVQSYIDCFGYDRVKQLMKRCGYASKGPSITSNGRTPPRTTVQPSPALSQGDARATGSVAGADNVLI